MSEDLVTVYGMPYPAPSEPPHEGRSCQAQVTGWACTRRPGHPGRHEATGTGGRLYASWPTGAVRDA